MKKKTKPIQEGDIVTYKGKEYKVVQLFTFGLATIENDETRICVQYEDLKKVR